MSPSRLIAGASGYSFQEWKGIFYPPDMKPEDMLAFYSERLPTVEINNTFYRMPGKAMLARWADRTPPTFRFAIKAPRRITHLARLDAEAVAEPVSHLYQAIAALGEKRGPVLFQLPPSVKVDLLRLREFLALLPEGHSAVFEFRNESWQCDNVYEELKRAGACLCLSEREDSAPPRFAETASWGYARLRMEQYAETDLRGWADRFRATGWQQIYVYFMHEPTAPAYARALMEYFD
jgi:uncharacterized protein YecE (DUF72 family)